MYQKLSWSAQLLAGLTLFGVSFLLQALVLSAFFDNPLLGFALAGGLEASKVLAIVLYRILRGQTRVPYPPGVQAIAVGFRLALVVLSAACSVMFLAERLDRPAMEETRRADLVAAQAERDRALVRIEARAEERRAQALAALDRQGEHDRADLRRRFEPVIADLEQQLSREMDNVQGGVFEGPRYRALAERLQQEKADWAAARARLAEQQAQQRAELLARIDRTATAQTDAARQRHAEQSAAIRADDYRGDRRAEHPQAHAFASVLGAVLEHEPDTLLLVFVFSLFLSVTLELGIVVAFEHLTLARLPVFHAEQRLDLGLREKRAETAAQLAGFDLDEAVTKAKVRRRRRRIEDDLHELAGGKVASPDTDAPQPV
ncbi:hypothetical protein [uncultured Thiohalocapsa sp.]|uniref:hypothetical protein n=1 Tax=uncultured Thiohalocapsa sp. TaxID=768990 RepID=UPI0025EADF7C|nr:hypothetical protein [uncultured Thiohalocapsa sp.]